MNSENNMIVQYYILFYDTATSLIEDRHFCVSQLKIIPSPNGKLIESIKPGG